MKSNVKDGDKFKPVSSIRGLKKTYSCIINNIYELELYNDMQNLFSDWMEHLDLSLYFFYIFLAAGLPYISRVQYSCLEGSVALPLTRSGAPEVLHTVGITDSRNSPNNFIK